MTDLRCPALPPSTPFDTEFFTDPYRTYERLLAEGPVHRIMTPDGVLAWLVTRYSDVRQGLADHRLVRNIKHAGGDYRRYPLPEEFTKSLVRSDPPEHTRLRKFMNMAFTPKRVRGLRPRITEIANQLVDDMGTHGETDLMASFAAPLPITIIADMLDIPHEQRVDFRHWADVILGVDLVQMREGGASMLCCLNEVIERKRKQSGDDLWSVWLEGRDEAGRGLDHHELIGMGFMVLIGGYDPTAGVIGCSVLALLDDPGKLKRLREAPELMPAAIEEFLRLYGSNHTAARRFAAEDVTIGDVTIPAGDTVLLSLGAADRDQARFDEPNCFDFNRADNRHVALGHGPHYCPGAELARIEVTVALETVLPRLPNMKLAVPAREVTLRPAYFIRSPIKLPVVY